MALAQAELPTLYDYYTGNGISSGLSTDQPYFTLNGKNISIYSGAMHYFRVPRQYWRDRLRKMRAAGLNTVETYFSWNLHQPTPDTFDFGDGGSDMQDFLNISEFLTIAKEEDLLVLARPGPYICAEWEFGGFPSWLLSDKNLKVRTSDESFMKPVTKYFNALLSILTLFQFTKGGPIIGFQVENEYASTKTDTFSPDKKYLQQLRQLYLDHNITELLYTADCISCFGSAGSLPEYFFLTANFGGYPDTDFEALQEIQPNRPLMAMEFYSGWFDHWSEQHNTRDLEEFKNQYTAIIKYPGSVNLYMFHGGTSWGFMNGANLNNDKTDNSGFQPDTTSYDYDSLVSEGGDYSEKYFAVKEILNQYNPVKTKLPPVPEVMNKTAYASIAVSQQLLLTGLLAQRVSFYSENLLPMEDFQSYGYIAYSKSDLTLRANATLKITGRVADTVMVLVNGKLVSPPLKDSASLDGFGSWRLNDSELILSEVALEKAELVLVVENWGRVNFGNLLQFNQNKGLWRNEIQIDGETLTSWEHRALPFGKKWIESIHSWSNVSTFSEPSLYRFLLNVDEAKDTFIDMRNWTKGIVIVNRFVLGRYSRIGPQQTLYLPGPFLQKGDNEIIVFEHYDGDKILKFSDVPIFATN